MACENCKKYDDCRTGSGLTWPCGAYRPAVITNADRIRTMSDEELAEFAIMSSKFFCTKKHDEVCEKPMGCTECALNWLQQPAPEEGEE